VFINGYIQKQARSRSSPCSCPWYHGKVTAVDPSSHVVCCEYRFTRSVRCRHISLTDITLFSLPKLHLSAFFLDCYGQIYFILPWLQPQRLDIWGSSAEEASGW
jgi:hypothetical protein